MIQMSFTLYLVVQNLFLAFSYVEIGVQHVSLFLKVFVIFIVLSFWSSVSEMEVVAFFQDFKKSFMALGGHFLQF